MNLLQKINCFKITKEIDKIRNNYSHLENLRFVAYNSLKGFNEKREEKINLINNIFSIKKYYKDKLNHSPIEIVENEKESLAKSKLNDLIMIIDPKIGKELKKYKDKEEKKEKEKEKTSLVFTHKIKEIIDAIYFSLSSKTPIIIKVIMAKEKYQQ